MTLLAVVLVTGGCGGDGKGGAEGAGTAPPVSLAGAVNNHGAKTASSATVELELDDFYFGPTFIKATPGQQIKIELHNEGAAPHTFTMAGVDEELQPGAKKTITITAPQSGLANFTCRFHVGQGMQGAIYVS